MRLSALATHIPDHRISAAQIVAAAGGSPAEAKVFQRMFGIEHVSATRPEETLDGLFSDLVARLSAAHTGEAPDALIYVRGHPS